MPLHAGDWSIYFGLKCASWGLGCRTQEARLLSKISPVQLSILAATLISTLLQWLGFMNKNSNFSDDL